MGRPSLHTPELIELICERLAEGTPLAEICRGEGMPAYRTVKDWIDDDARYPGVGAVIARAREAGEDRIASDCLVIADTPIAAEVVTIERREVKRTQEQIDAGIPAEYEEVVVERRREDAIQHRKLQIDTRLKLLAKFNPKRWGDRQTLAGDPDAPLVMYGSLTNEQLDQRLRELGVKTDD